MADPTVLDGPPPRTAPNGDRYDAEFLANRFVVSFPTGRPRGRSLEVRGHDGTLMFVVVARRSRAGLALAGSLALLALAPVLLAWYGVYELLNLPFFSQGAWSLAAALAAGLPLAAMAWLLRAPGWECVFHRAGSHAPRLKTRESFHSFGQVRLYGVEGPRGEPVGVVAQPLAGDLLRARWTLSTGPPEDWEPGEEVACVTEVPLAWALIRRVLLRPQARWLQTGLVFQPSPRAPRLARLKRRQQRFGGAVVDCADDLEGVLDRRLVLAACALSMLRERPVARLKKRAVAGAD